VQFGLKIGRPSYDIVTKTHLVECKNLYWEAYKNNQETLDGLVKQARIGVQNARSIGKQYTWITKNKIPEELAWLREKIINMGIEVIDG